LEKVAVDCFKGRNGIKQGKTPLDGQLSWFTHQLRDCELG
jgi:hypothetical protein